MGNSPLLSARRFAYWSGGPDSQEGQSGPFAYDEHGDEQRSLHGTHPFEMLRWGARRGYRGERLLSVCVIGPSSSRRRPAVRDPWWPRGPDGCPAPHDNGDHGMAFRASAMASMKAGASGEPQPVVRSQPVRTG